MDRKLKIGLQLFSVLDYMKNDYLGTLKKAAEMGYEGVEFAGENMYGGFQPDELKKVLEELGLVPISSHIPIHKFNSDFDGVVEYAKKLGMNKLVIPNYPEEGRKDAEAYKKTAEEIEKIGLRCRAEGIELCYHNHDTEFRKFEGEFGLDLLRKYTSQEGLSFEVDTAFAVIEGVDPSDFLIERDRITLVHLKDPERNFSKPYHFEPVGNGLLDLPSVLAACKQTGIEWVIVEVSKCRMDKLEAVRKSLQNIKALV